MIKGTPRLATFSPRGPASNSINTQHTTSGYPLKVVESGLYYLLYYLFKLCAREEQKWVSLPLILTPGVPIES